MQANIFVALSTWLLGLACWDIEVQLPVHLCVSQPPVSLKSDPKCCCVGPQHCIEGHLRLTFILMNIHEHEVPHSANEISCNIWQFGNDVCLEKRIGSPFSCWCKMKYLSYKDTDWFYFTWNIWYIAKVYPPLWMFTKLHIWNVKCHLTSRAMGYRPQFWK